MMENNDKTNQPTVIHHANSLADNHTQTSQVSKTLDQLGSELSGEKIGEFTNAEIASVMNPARLNQLLTQADAFTRVNSEDLDDF